MMKKKIFKNVCLILKNKVLNYKIKKKLLKNEKNL